MPMEILAQSVQERDSRHYLTDFDESDETEYLAEIQENCKKRVKFYSVSGTYVNFLSFCIK